MASRAKKNSPAMLAAAAPALELFDAPAAAPAVNPGQQLALDLSANRVISASAGTGKTHTLIALYVGLLEGRLVPGGKYLDETEWLRRASDDSFERMTPGEIVVVTYTDKAAAELRQRARETLEKRAARTDIGDAMKDHLRRCARELSGAPVCTIHAFCARMLRESGAHGAAPAAFSVLESDEADEILKAALSAAAGEMLESAAHAELEKIAAAWSLFAPRTGLVEIGSRLLAQLRTCGLAPDALRASATTAPLSLEQIREKLALLYAAVPVAKTKGNSKPCSELLELCSIKKFPASIEEARLLALEIAPLIKGKWFENNALENPCAEIVSAAHVPYVGALQTYLELALEKYTRAKRAADSVDFDDLLLCARDILKTHPARPCRFVLIDEFQDTNPLQKEILWRVAFNDSAPGRDARLCVVGDVKQSIYRFRGADVSLMEQACATLQTSPLSENYRSRAVLLEFINAFCENMWRGTAFNYSALHKLAPMQNASRHAWQAPAAELLCWDEADVGNAAQHRAQQAVAIARRIQTFVQRRTGSALTQPQIFDRATNVMHDKVRYKDIAILANSLKNLRQPLQLALTQLRIPFQILGGVSFYARQEVIDAMSLWGAACDPGDAYAVAGLLRSPFVCLSDAGLWRLCENWNDFQKERHGAQRISAGHALLNDTFMRALKPEQFSAADFAALARAEKILAAVSGMAGRNSAVEILDYALRESGYLALLAMQPRGEISVAAVRKTIELARAFESKGNAHLSDFVRWMKQRADAEWDDPGHSGGPSLADDLAPGDSDGVVSIGTIHSAKGLEFPIVFIPELGAQARNITDAALFSTQHGLGLKLAAYSEGLPALADDIQRLNAGLEKQEAEAESLRKFYVALTRAREYLVLLGEITYHGSGSWRKLVDQFQQQQPDKITCVSARHPELKDATAGAARGILEFTGGAVHVHRAAGAPANIAAALPDLEIENQLLVQAAAGRTRVSVSRFAHWLWCPRQALFQAQDAALELAPAADREGAALGLEEFSDADGALEPDARALGTAAHAALEFIFGSENPTAPETAERAAECFLRALGGLENHPSVKQTLERVLALTRSNFGKSVLALDPGERFVERPFRWRVASSGDDKFSLTLSGQIDLLARRDNARWDIVDFKLSSYSKDGAHAAALARYAWQAGIYAQVAAQILNLPVAQISASLAFLKDDDNQPRALEALGHVQASIETLRHAARQFAALAAINEPLELPAQRWLPQDAAPRERHVSMCRDERCPFVEKCFGKKT